MSLADAVVELLEELERVARLHEEVTDTDVREALHAALTRGFVWGRKARGRPRSGCSPPRAMRGWRPHCTAFFGQPRWLRRPKT